MRVQVNLATRPFVELRPFFLRLRLLMAVLAAGGVALFLTAHFLSVKAERQQIELDRVREQTIAAQRLKLRTEGRLRQPGNAQILDRAHFLNTVFLRKSFSWTAVMMDLENVLPTGVQVTSIEPAVTAEGEVTIRLRVAGERDRAVQLVRNLERSRRFLAPRLGSESAQAKETGSNGGRPSVGLSSVSTAPPGVEFEILATYNPLPAGEAFAVKHSRPAAQNQADAQAVIQSYLSQHPAAGSSSVSPGASAATVGAPGSSQASARRRGYPRDGVVLPPYSGRGGPMRQAMPGFGVPPAGTSQSGSRRAQGGSQ